jgi:CDP-glucose 4,6-dehydratase
MVDLGKFQNFWKNKRVFLTGHTGFKGCWLLSWLKMLGSDVFGYSLPPLEPSFYESVCEDKETRGVFADIRDGKRLKEELGSFNPEIVFHLAAQPLVRESYREPVLTYETNVMGTVNLLEAVRSAGSVKCVVVITTDKCYKDMNWEWGYRETDTLGGADPYSSSKACVELLCEAWRSSFLAKTGAPLATARTGNVIGGGDWAADRIVPDAMRAFQKKVPLVIRSPRAIRPWQHVLEPLYGYMTLAERLYEGDVSCANAWNFGSSADDSRDVESVASLLAELWGDGARYEVSENSTLHESRLLRLDSSKAAQKLEWRPVFDFEEAVSLTVEWYRRVFDGDLPAAVSGEHIRKYMDKVKDSER